ncbi:MAG: RNA 2',3'-cyclic phosphodiesterase [Candidatus Moraniibacteriota bacterium]
MKRKIYININIPDKTKRRLIASVEKWQKLPVKWAKEANLCITLFFIGYVDNEVVIDICEKVRKAVKDFDIFDLEFERLILAPNQDKAQSIQISGKASNLIKNLHTAIEKELGIFVAEKKAFAPHITLGKIRKIQWDALLEKPIINEKISFAVNVESVDIMASHFGEGKNSFVLIESCPLK